MDLLLLSARVLVAAALYLFLGAIVLVLWRDMRRPTKESPAVPRRYGRLVIVAVDADDRALQEACPLGMSFPLQPITSLGRAATNTIVIPDAYSSSEHALLTLRGGQWWLEDRGSRNGTTLNNMVIDDPTVVSSGEVIGVGRVQLKLTLADL